MIQYAIITVSVVLISIAQIGIKWRLNGLHRAMPSALDEIPGFVFDVIRDPMIWAAGATIIVAAVLWYYSLSRMQLGVAIGFAALSYPMIMAGSYLFLGESFNAVNCLGCALIVAGVYCLTV